MEAVLLSVHVLAGILFIGPVAVVSSLFPRYVPRATSLRTSPDLRSLPVAASLHRITRVYGLLGLIVPIVGIALMFVQGRFGEIWITVAMVITAAAGGLLAFRIVPAQAAALSDPPSDTGLRRLGGMVGGFNAMWAAVVILMIARPGSDYVS